MITMKHKNILYCIFVYILLYILYISHIIAYIYFSTIKMKHKNIASIIGKQT